MRILDLTPRHARIAFDSFTDLLDSVETRPMALAESSYTMTRHTTGHVHGYHVTETLPECITLARRGWAEGTGQVKALVDALDITGRVHRKVIAYDVVGDGGYDMGRVMSGQPECAMQWGDTEDISHAYGDIIRIDVNIAYSAGIRIEQIMHRGAVICALVDALETSGKRCEIRVVQSWEGSGVRLDFEFPVKAADEPLQLDQFAFMVGHPDMLRRLTWCLYAYHPHGWTLDKVSMGTPADYKTEAEVYIPRMHYDEVQWRNEASCRQWLVAKLLSLGVTLEEKEA